jgi:PAS domain S-box-containing protein
MKPKEADRLCRERLDVVPDWILEVDAHGTITYSNRVVEDMLGLHPDEILGSRIYDLVAATDDEKCRECLEQAMELKQPCRNTIVSFKDASGGAKPLAVGCVPVTPGGPLPGGLRVIARDVSDVEAAHKAAREASDNYRSVLENSPIGIMIVQNERVVYANPEVMSLLGYTLEDAAEGDVWRFVHPDDVERVKESYRRRMAGEHPPEQYEIKVLTKSGDVRQFELRATLITYDDQPAILDSVVDITERKRAEQALAETEAKYRTLVEESLVGICIIQEGRFAYANRRLGEILGYSPDQLMTQVSVLDTIAPEDRDAVEQDLRARSSGNVSSFGYAFKAIRKDGEKRDAEAQGIPGMFRGKPAVFGSITDRTDQVRAETELRHRMEMEKVLIGLSTQFINLPSGEIDSGIEHALETVGDFIAADRGFIFTIDESGETVTATHEWCAEGVPATIDLVPSLRIDDYDLLKRGLHGTEAQQIPSVAALPPDMTDIRELLESEDVKSLIGLPMVSGGQPIGFLGFETVRIEKTWDEDTITLLRILGEVFVNALERKRSEQALAEAEAKYRNLTEESLVGIHVIQDGKLAYVNSRLTEMLGYSAEELRSASSIMEFVHPDDHLRTEELYRELMANPTATAQAFRVVRKDGSTMDVEVYMVPTTFQGNPALFGSMLDVTNRVRAEAEVKHLAELEKVLVGLSTEFINLPSEEIDSGIERALGVIGEFIEADRGYICTADECGDAVTPTHRWIAQGVPAERRSYSDLDVGSFSIVREGLAGTQAVYVPDVDKLSDENAALRTLMQSEHVKSVIALPMISHGRPIGFLGFVAIRAQRSWTEETVTLLRILGEVFVNALERKRSEHALRQSEDLLSRAFDAIQDGVSVLDPDLNIVRVNAKMEEWYSHKLPIIGKKCYDVYHNRDRPCEVCPTLRARHDKSPQMDIVPLEGPEGVTGWHELYSHPMIDAEGRCTGVVEYVRDITERRKDEERLAKLTQTLLSFGPDPLVNINLLTGLVGELTNASSALYNRLEDQMLCSWGQWNVPTDYVAVDKPEGHICYELIRRGKAEPLVIRNLPGTPYAQTDPNVSKYGLQTYVGYPVKIGEEFVGSLCVVYQRDYEPSQDDLQLLSVAASAIGVEERRKYSEDALRDSEERYRLLFQSSPDVVFVLKGSSFVDVSPAVRTVLGYEPEDVIGKPPWFISPQHQPDGTDSTEKAEMHISRALEQGPQHFDWLHKAKDGSPVDCSVSLVAYTLKGETYVQAIVRDITERKRAEAQRRAFEKRIEEQKRHFYRDTILSVTDGKLDICDPPELKPYIAGAQIKVDVPDASQVSPARREAERFCREHGLDGERLDTFMIGVGEAITNAIKHANSGRVYAGARDGTVWVGVADKGSGISSLILPRATLLRGFSTKPSLGLGYTIMLEVSDHILLKTGERGTMVVLVRDLSEPEITLAPEVLPDTWNTVPS